MLLKYKHEEVDVLDVASLTEGYLPSDLMILVERGKLLGKV